MRSIWPSRDLPAPQEVSWDWTDMRARCLVEARRFLRHPDDAEEAVQEALLRAWRQSSLCRTPDRPLPWLLQITRNEALRIHARGRRFETVVHDEDASLAREDPAVARVIDRLATRAALAGLRAEDRVLVGLRYVEDLTQPQVAEALDLPEGTVKVRLHRVRGRLRSALAAETCS